ncbi:MAG: YhfC family intramembrane metalloprotease [Clostridiales bacterium]|jgi:uncharacterized membrane protein YhfC|nr:YhfC family intramembrane metalloprotease [Clostridiales bacterium]
MRVSILSVVFMTISAILSIGTPLFLFFFFKKRLLLKVVPLLAGIAGFVVFALILEQLVHIVVLKPSPTGEIALKSKPILFILYGCFMAGIFEESSRFILFHVLKKKYSGIGTGLSYGIGHGGIEAILITGASMIGNLVLSVVINLGLTSVPPEIISGLTEIAPYMFLIGGFERIFAIAIQISLSVIVFYSVFYNGKWWIYPLAIIVHAIIDLPAILMQIEVIKNIFFVEGLTFLSSIILIFLAKYIHENFAADADIPAR